MNTVRLTEVSEAVRVFLNQVLQGDGAVIEDEAGRTRGQFVPYRDPTPNEERRANESLKRLHEKTTEAMARHGVTEEDIDRDLQEDD
jgi:hypothetical protein